ncbi:MAG: class I SAM-dependent methyltransferase [Chloroflexi bacterium]|nr:class I SAM-dependent methyltransferase [Chloroflexota bacterium]
MDALKLWMEQLILWSPPKNDSLSPKGPDDDWTKMAKWFGKMAPQIEEGGSPLLLRVEELVDSRSVVLDVGAGSGRLAIPLAPKVGKILAVESSPAMRSALQTRIAELGADNVEVVAGRWPGIEVPQVDIAFCANVVYDVADLGPFLLKMDQVAKHHCFIQLTPRHPLDAFRELWEEFVGWTPPHGPTYLDAVECLRQLGIEPRVEVAPSKRWLRFRDPIEATAFYRDRLGLAEGSGVQEALQERVAERGCMRNGNWIPDWQFDKTVILSWSRK